MARDYNIYNERNQKIGELRGEDTELDKLLYEMRSEEAEKRSRAKLAAQLLQQYKAICAAQDALDLLKKDENSTDAAAIERLELRKNYLATLRAKNKAARKLAPWKFLKKACGILFWIAAFPVCLAISFSIPLYDLWPFIVAAGVFGVAYLACRNKVYRLPWPDSFDKRAANLPIDLEKRMPEDLQNCAWHYAASELADKK